MGRMAARSPLAKGIPFFVLMGVGTYALSLFVQTRYDFVVRYSCLPAPPKQLSLHRRIQIPGAGVVSGGCLRRTSTRRC